MLKTKKISTKNIVLIAVLCMISVIFFSLMTSSQADASRRGPRQQSYEYHSNGFVSKHITSKGNVEHHRNYNEDGQLTHTEWYNGGQLHTPIDMIPTVVKYHDNGQIKVEERYRFGSLGRNDTTKPVQICYNQDGTVVYELWMNGTTQGDVNLCEF